MRPHEATVYEKSKTSVICQSAPVIVNAKITTMTIVDPEFVMIVISIERLCMRQTNIPISVFIP